MVREIHLSEKDCVWPAGTILGEGPVWHERHGVLYFVDIKAPALLSYEPEGRVCRRIGVAKALGCVAPTRSDLLVAGFTDGVFFLDPQSGARALLIDPESDIPGNRLNDGRCDSHGHLWVGSMDDNENDLTGALWRVEPSGTCRKMDYGYCITNGPAFNPDQSVLYHTDTLARTIYRFEIGSDASLSRKTVFAKIDETEGYPDGLCVDEQGGVWSGHWAGGQLTRFTPDGKPDLVVRLPTQNVTSCAFGGKDLSTLFITTARKGLSREQVSQQPLAGGLFAARVGYRGLPAFSFAAEGV